MNTYTCKSCGAEFSSKKGCKSRIPMYCSSKCYGETLKISSKCKSCSKEIESKHGVKKAGRVYCSKECQGLVRRGGSLNNEWRAALSAGRKKSEKCKGPNLYNWKGGKENARRIAKERYMKAKYGAGRLPVEYLKRVLVAQKMMCFYCECSLSKYKAIEHLTPLARGGKNETYNLVYSCKSCNSKKNKLTLEEFAIKNGRFDWIDKFDEVYATAID